MSDHTAAIVAFAVAALGVLLAFVVSGLHLSRQVNSPLNGAATVVLSTLFIVLASVLLVWGILHLGFSHAR